MQKEKYMIKYYKFGLYIIIVILINLAGGNLFFRFDLTSNGLYSLSKASKNSVSTLNEPLTINVFFTKNLPAPYNNVERYLHDLLEGYSLHANDYLSYRFFDVSASEGDLSEKAEENRKKAQDYGIYPVNVQRIEQDEAKIQRAYMGMVFIHGDIIEKLPALTSTEGLEYKITSTIQKMNNKISALLGLSQKIKVNLIQSSSLNQIAADVNLQGLGELRNNISDVVKELNSKAYNQLEFEFIDPSTQTIDDEALRRYERFGLQWPEIKKENDVVIPAGRGMIALGLEYGEKTFERPLLNKSLNLTNRGLQEQFQIVEMDQIKVFIDENIDNLISIHDEIGYLSTHGTHTLSASLPPQLQMMQQQQPGGLTRFNSLLSNSYSITQVMLKEEIPESIDTLIIAGAKENFSDWELFQIDQFLMKGKSLAIFMESFNEIQQQNPQMQMYQQREPVYLPLNTGLEKLLESYGAKVKKSYIMDESCYVNRDQNTGEMPLYFAPIVKNEYINHKVDFIENIKELILIKASPVEIDTEKADKYKLKVQELFSSTKNSWEMAGRINLMPWMIRPPANPDEKKSLPLAYLMEGEFPSYFADKAIPEKPEEEPEETNTEGEDAEGEDAEEKKEEEKPPVQESDIKSGKAVLAKGLPGKIFLIGTSEILKDNILDEQGTSPNAVFLMNTFDYLNGKSDVATMRSKQQRFNPLKDTKAGTRSFIKILNIVGLPILMILAGIFVWFRRKAKRKTIQAMFLQNKKA